MVEWKNRFYENYLSTFKSSKESSALERSIETSHSMKPSHLSLMLQTALLVPTKAASNSTAPNGGQPIIIDTDIMSDVDDVGSLAVANVLHNCGLADLRGVVINTHSRYGSLAANVSMLTPKQRRCRRLTDCRLSAHISATLMYLSRLFDL